MDKQKAIKLLKQKSKEAVKIAEQPYYANEYIRWRRNIEDILESAFGVNSTEYKRIAEYEAPRIKGTRTELQKAYMRIVYRIQQEVDSIIQKYETLGIEKPIEETKQKDAVKLPIQLFDAMQFHPKVVKASKLLFETGNYASAILEAFKAVNIFVKEKSGLSKNALRGVKDRQLMAKVFDEKVPLIKLNELITDTDFNEQEGFKLLFMGATEGIRNPKAHDLIEMKDPYRTLEYLGFASLLMHKISFWKVE